MGKITEIIDEAAYKQFEKLLLLTREAQSDFSALVGTVSELTKELGKAGSMREFEVTIVKAEKATDALAEANKKVEKTSKEAAKAETEVIAASKLRASTIADSKKALDTYSGTLDENIRQQLAIKLALQDNAARIKVLNKDYKDGKVTADAYANEIEDLNRVQVEGRKALVDYNLEVRRALKENTAAEGSYDELSATLDRLRGLYRRLSAEERENKEVGGALTAQIQEYDKTLKDLDKSIGITNRNVGNYSESITDALDATGLFSDQIQFLAKAKQIYQAGAAAATTATKSFGLALKAAGIGLLLAVFAGLVSYLTRFQGGMDKVSMIMAKVGAAVTVLVSVFGKLGEQLLNSVMPVLRGIGDVLLGIVTLDYDLIKEGINGIGEAVSNIDPIRITDLAKAMADAVEQAEALRNAEVALEENTIKYTKEQAKLNKELEYYNAIADDATLSFKEQNKANLAALDIQQRLSNETVKLAKQQESLVTARVQIARANGTINRTLEQEEADAIAKRIEAETAFTSAVMANARQRRQLKQDQLEQDLDILIDGFDNQKSINERLIANERLAFGKRQDILNETKELALGSFEDQIKVIQMFTKEKVDGDDLIATSDARVLNQKIKDLEVSEIIGKRLLEIVRDRKTAIIDLNEVELELAEERREKERESQEKYTAAKVQDMTRESSTLLLELERREAEALQILATSYANREMTETEYNLERLNIQRRTTKEYIETEIDALQRLIDFNKLRGLDVFDQEQQLAALKIRLSKATTDAQIEDLLRLQEVEAELAEKRRELLTEVANLGIQLVNQRFEKELETVQKQREQVEETKELEIERANESITNERERNIKIAQIEATAAKQKDALFEREKQIKIRQANFEKLVNIGRIISNTAVGISAQLPGLPLTAGLIATIAAIGAVQLAQAVAVPIPEYYKGVTRSKEGLAWVGERGAEMRIEPDGTQSLTPAKPTLTWLKKGTEIIPAGETQKRLASMAVSRVAESDRAVNSTTFSTKALEEAYRKETKKVVNALTKKPEKVTTFTEQGARHLLKSANGWAEYIGRNI